LNRAAVKRTTVQVSRLPLYYSIGQLGHGVQHKAWADGSHEHLVFASV
jgi:predicted HD phosphohydrolase